MTILSVSSSHAQIQAKSTDLSVFAGFAKGLDVDVEFRVEGEQQPREGTIEGGSEFMFGARYSYNFTGNNSLEGNVGFIIPDGGKIYLYHVNYRYNFKTGDGSVFPYVTGGIGATTVSPDEGDSQTNLSYNFGGGAGFFIGDSFVIRADIRDHFLRADEASGEIQGTAITIESYTQQVLEFSVGLSYFFM